MKRIAEFCRRTATCIAAIACAFGLGTARVTHADGVAAPDPQAVCDRRGAGSPATIDAQRPRGPVLSRSAHGAMGVARRASAPTRSPGRAGLVVEVDPLPGETSAASGADGTLHADRVPAPVRSTDGLELLMLPDGSRRVNLEGRFRSYSMLTIAADGTLTMACADDHASALGLASAATPRSPAPRAQRPIVGPREE